jgi:hypothetical protein
MRQHTEAVERVSVLFLTLKHNPEKSVCVNCGPKTEKRVGGVANWHESETCKKKVIIDMDSDWSQFLSIHILFIAYVICAYPRFRGHLFF